MYYLSTVISEFFVHQILFGFFRKTEIEKNKVQSIVYENNTKENYTPSKIPSSTNDEYIPHKFFHKVQYFLLYYLNTNIPHHYK